LQFVIPYLYYKTEAEGLIVLADSNHSIFQPEGSNERLFQLQRQVENQVSRLKHLSGRPLLRVAVGIAVPAIEAWLLHPQRSGINEEVWRKGLLSKQYPYSKLDLKRHLYGVDRPSINLETMKMTEAATMLCSHLSQLESQFPVGFGSLAQGLRQWRHF